VHAALAPTNAITTTDESADEFTGCVVCVVLIQRLRFLLRNFSGISKFHGFFTVDWRWGWLAVRGACVRAMHCETKTKTIEYPTK